MFMISVETEIMGRLLEMPSGVLPLENLMVHIRLMGLMIISKRVIFLISMVPIQWQSNSGSKLLLIPKPSL